MTRSFRTLEQWAERSRTMKEVEVARRGTSKHRSVEQENYIANAYGGTRSRSSGAADTDAGDVRTGRALIECKCTGTEAPARSISLRVVDWEKIRDEAYAEERHPEMALRIYCPDSPAADVNGNIDLVVREVHIDNWLIQEAGY